MGTLQKRPNGNWTGKVRKQGFPALSATFPTKKEAERWITEQEAKMNAGGFQHLNGKPLLRDLIKHYMAEVSPTKKGEREEVWRLKALMRMRSLRTRSGS